MLEEPSQRVHKNSDEYQKIMRSVHNLQKKLLKSSDNKQAAREEYVKGMEKIMHNIKMYYLHKAKDGIAADATYDKLTAVKRVEKLLQSRYKEENNEIKRSNSIGGTNVNQTLENADKKVTENKKPEGVSIT